MAKVFGVWIRQYAPPPSSHVIPFKMLYWNLIAQKTLHSNQSVISGEFLFSILRVGTSADLNVMFRCPTDYELVGNQIVECNYQNGRFEWSSDIPVCEFAGILSTEAPTMSSTVEIPDDIGSPNEPGTNPGTGSESTEEKGDCEGSIALECWSKLQV